MSNLTVEDFYVLKLKNMWQHFKREHFSFWMICCYLFFEFVRPQALFPEIDVLPWAQLFLMGSLAGAVMDKSVKWVGNPNNKWMILYLLLVIVSISNAHYPEVSRKHFMDFFGWFVIYFLIINIVNTKERFYIFLVIYLLAAAKISTGTSKSWIMRGFSFTSWGLMGPKGYFQNSGELAILMLMLFPLAYYLYKALGSRLGRLEKWILIVFWVSPILTILGASSRGAQIGLVVELAIIFRKSFFKVKTLIGIVVLAGTLFQLLPEEQKQRFANSGDDKTSQQRLLYWRHGMDMIQENMATGVGFFNFIPYYEQHFPQDMLYEFAELPHNIFIQVGTDAGVGAIFILAILLFNCFWGSFRLAIKKDSDDVRRSIAAGLGFGVLGFFLAGQFVTVTYYPFLWIHLAFLVAFSNIIETSKNAKWI